MYYFAYGSNMCHKQMKERCPKSKYIRKAFLKDYKFVYDGYSKKRQGAVGNIIKSPGCVVWGGLFEITKECLKRLDVCEGYSKAYNRTMMQLEDVTGQTCDAIVYYRTGEKAGEPSNEYRQIVIDGVRDCGIDEVYIHKFLNSNRSDGI